MLSASLSSDSRYCSNTCRSGWSWRRSPIQGHHPDGRRTLQHPSRWIHIERWPGGHLPFLYAAERTAGRAGLCTTIAGRVKCRSQPIRWYACPIAPSAPYLSLRCSELPSPRRMADMRGLKSRQRTMTRTSVNASSITSNWFLFPFFQAFRPRGCVFFFCFRKASPHRWRQAGDGEYAPDREEDCPSPPARRSGLTHWRIGLNSQERIHANTRGRTNGRAASGQKKNLAAGQRFQNQTDVLRFSLSTE